MEAEQLQKVKDSSGLHTFFKLESTISLTNMILFDKNGCLKKFNDTEEILRDFYKVRINFYFQRKQHVEGKLEAEALRIKEVSGYIQGRINGSLVIENVKTKDIIANLEAKNFASDPVKKWKADQAKADQAKLEANAPPTDNGSDSESDLDKDENGRQDYKYLMEDLPQKAYSYENIKALENKKEKKNNELQRLKKQTPEDLWNIDLDEFMVEWEKEEKKAGGAEAVTGNVVLPTITDEHLKKEDIAGKRKRRESPYLDPVPGVPGTSGYRTRTSRQESSDED